MRLYALPPAPATWILEHLPTWSLREGPYGLALWQWMVLPLAALLSLLAGVLASRVIARLAGPFARRRAAAWGVRSVERARGPLTLFTALGVARALLPSLALAEGPRDSLVSVLVAGLLFGVFWSLWRVVDLAATALAAAPRLQDSAARSLLSLGVKGAKVVLFLLGAIAALEHLGLQVGSLIAGLGIGGLAFALAAQKTIENLFGSFTLGVDRPLAIGDTVKIEDFTATVEQIGLRSTRLRTIDHTIITIPNGRLADMRIENISQRDRIRFATNLALAYGTDSDKLRAIIAEAREHLRGTEKVEADSVTVALVALAESSLTIEVNAWFESTAFDEYRAFREEALLALMAIVEKHGAGFAFPTRTLRLEPR